MAPSQRRVPRKKINRPVGVLFDGVYQIGRVLQVGEGGILLETQFPLKAEDRVLITFSLKGDQFITTKATIRYLNNENAATHSGEKFGVEFDELPFQARREIRSFVASNSELKTRNSFT